MNKINKSLFIEKHLIPSSHRNNYKIKKIKSNLTIDNNNTSKNLSKNKNLLKKSYIRTKSNDNKNSKLLEAQKKALIRSKIFENMNIKNNKTNKLNNKLKKNKNKLDYRESKLNSLIKVNVIKRNENYSLTANNTIEKNVTLKDHRKSKNKRPISKEEINEKNFNNHNPMYNLISQENFYNNKISKISLIQNRWKQYLYSHKYLYNKYERIKRAKTRAFFIKFKKVMYAYIFKLLKINEFNIRYYLRFWHKKTYLNKILKKIIYLKKYNVKKFQKNILMKKSNLSSRQIRSNFNRVKLPYINNISNTNFSTLNKNLSSINNTSTNNQINNFMQNTISSSFSKINSMRKIYNKSSDKSNNNIYKNNNSIKKFNKKTKSALKNLFKNNEINLNSLNSITPSNKINKYKNNFYNRAIKFNTINDYNEHKINKNIKNRSLRTILSKNKNVLLNKNNSYNNYIYDDIKNVSPKTTINRRNKNQHKIWININTTNSINIIKNNIIFKNRFNKLSKLDTCPLSIFGKKRNKPLINITKINKYFIHWKNINFKTKFIKYLISIKNKIKIRNLFFRKIIRIILDFLQIIILKKYFDKYNNRDINTNLLLKLRALLLKNKKLKEQLDLTNKENINYFDIKGIDIINNININNFGNCNNTNKIIYLDKPNNIFNKFIQANNFKFPLEYKNNENINFVNDKNNKIITIKNSYPKGAFVAQINQLRMIFNLIDKHIQNNISMKDYFQIWKKNIKRNYKKIDISKKEGKLELNRCIKINKNKIGSTRDNYRYNNEKQKFQNNKTIKLIDNLNKKKIDNSSELSTYKTQINSEIVYTKKILNRNNQILNNNNNKIKNIFLKINQAQSKKNKIEEREVYFNYLSKNKNNSFTKNIINENINNKDDKLTESGIKNKISKIKIEFLDNPMKKNKKEKIINYNIIFENIKKLFTKKIRALDFKIVNQTFCSPLVNYLDEI